MLNRVYRVFYSAFLRSLDSEAALKTWLGCNLVAISFDGRIILLMLMSLGTIIPDNQRKRKFLMSIDHIIIAFLKIKSLIQSKSLEEIFMKSHSFLKTF